MKSSTVLPVALLALSALANAGCGDDTAVTPAAPDASSYDGAANSDSSLADGTVPGDAANASDALVVGDASALSDAQIIGVAMTANDGEIEQALLALGGVAPVPEGGADAEAPDLAAFDGGSPRTTNSLVTAFAQTMIADHTTSNGVLAGFGAPDTSLVQQTLQAAALATTTSLSPLSGAAFDVQYMSAQVAQHQNVLAIVQGTLIPQASNPALKAYLANTLLPAVQMHLTHAMTIVSQLDGGAPDSGQSADASSADANDAAFASGE